MTKKKTKTKSKKSQAKKPVIIINANLSFDDLLTASLQPTPEFLKKKEAVKKRLEKEKLEKEKKKLNKKK